MAVSFARSEGVVFLKPPNALLARGLPATYAARASEGKESPVASIWAATLMNGAEALLCMLHAGLRHVCSWCWNVKPLLWS